MLKFKLDAVLLTIMHKETDKTDVNRWLLLTDSFASWHQIYQAEENDTNILTVKNIILFATKMLQLLVRSYFSKLGWLKAK